MAIPKLQSYALPTALDIPTNKVNWAFEPEARCAAHPRYAGLLCQLLGPQLPNDGPGNCQYRRSAPVL